MTSLGLAVTTHDSAHSVQLGIIMMAPDAIQLLATQVAGASA